MHIAVVGLGFGESFVPIYLAHPQVSRVTICDSNAELANRIREQYGVVNVVSTLDAVLSDESIDAVHLLTPLPLHVPHTLAVLDAGKHCACAVTMAQTLPEIEQIVRATQTAKRNYMMMETAVYTREYFFARGLLERGELGEITFLQGDYYQDLEASYPDYWRFVPPMHYATHALAPLLALADSSVQRVSCLGVGRLRADICADPKNPFPMQTAHFQLSNSSAVAQVNRAWYQTARPYTESFSVYGDKKGFEWQQQEHEDPLLFELEPVHNAHRWRHCHSERISVPFRPDLLPPELAQFADGGHGGSHAHLAHEFVMSIVEGRKAAIDEIVSANWCAPGLCAHESSLRNGEWIEVPKF